MVIAMLFSGQWREFWYIAEQGGLGNSWLSGPGIIFAKYFIPTFFAITAMILTLPKYKKAISIAWGGMVIGFIIAILIFTKILYEISTEQFIADIIGALAYATGIICGLYYAGQKENL